MKTMSLSGAVAAQFKLILLEKCSGSGQSGGRESCLEAGWLELDARCLFYLFTAVLGYILIFTISLGQLPLLFKILRWQSGHGYVSTVRASLLVVISSTNVAYAVNKNLPISTWGEAILLMMQGVIIMNLIFVYHGRHRNAIGFMLLYTPIMVVLLWPLVSHKVILALKIISLPLTVCVKLRNIYKSHQQHRRQAEGKEDSDKTPRTVAQFPSTSSLLLLNLGSSGRLLTAVVDTRDPLMVAGYCLECLLDYTLTTHVLHYRRKNTVPHKHTEKPVVMGVQKRKDRGLG